MKTSHINHVVLYAKNFYRHTGDIIKDMQRFMQLDGHPYCTIKTPEKLQQVMRKDYIEWANSLPDNFQSKDFIIKGIDNKVRWADGPEAYIHHYMSSYAIYIPLTGAQLGYPIYDKYHLPQFYTKEHLFDGNMSYEEMMKVAKEYLDESQESRFDTYMNNLLEKYQFEKVAKVFNLLGDPVTAKELEDEMWDLYTKFMDEHVYENGEMAQGWYTELSKHFDLHFTTNNYSVGIDVQALFATQELSVKGEYCDKTIKELFKNASTNTEFITNVIKAGNAINNIFTYEGWLAFNHTIPEDRLTFDSISDNIKSMTSYFIEDGLKKQDVINDEKKSSWIASGYGKYIVSVEENKVTLKILFEHIYETVCMDERLWNGKCGDEKAY